MQAVLDHAWRAKRPDVTTLLRICLEPPIRQHMASWPGFWRLACAALPVEFVVERVREGVSDGAPWTKEQLSCLVTAGYLREVVELLGDPVLRVHACSVLTKDNRSWPTGIHSDTLRFAATAFELGVAPESGSLAMDLVVAALNWDPAASLAWLAARVPKLPKGPRRTWVALALGSLGSDEQRMVVLRWLEAD